jgi:hypothetical protein
MENFDYGEDSLVDAGTCRGNDDDIKYIRADLAIEKALIFSCDKCGDSGMYYNADAYRCKGVYPDKECSCRKKKTCPCTENPHSIYSIKKGLK